MRDRGNALADTRDACATRTAKPCYDAAIMTSQVLSEKVGVVFGVANKRSIAWAIAKAWAAAGARLIFNYQGERIKENVAELVGEFGENVPLYPCDVSNDEEIAKFFQEVRGSYPPAATAGGRLEHL